MLIDWLTDREREREREREWSNASACGGGAPHVRDARNLFGAPDDDVRVGRGNLSLSGSLDDVGSALQMCRLSHLRYHDNIVHLDGLDVALLPVHSRLTCRSVSVHTIMLLCGLDEALRCGPLH